MKPQSRKITKNQGHKVKNRLAQTTGSESLVVLRKAYSLKLEEFVKQNGFTRGVRDWWVERMVNRQIKR